MKKIFYFAASALMLMACAKTEELGFNENKEANEGIKFEVYSQRANGTKAGTPNDITNENIGNIGFGVFAYYTAGEQYDNNAKPNFMYNQKVTKAGTATEWTYEPVKYWPNEYGNAAYSDETDYVTFFAYAPWTKFEPTTGAAVVPAFPSDNMTDAEKQAFTENQQKKNIISVNKNNISGDPIVKYVVDTDPATSVDLLWGVAASNAAANYSTIDKSENPVKAGFPFINLVKPGNPVNDKISFNLKHSLAKVKFTIDYIADDFTPDGDSEQINADETRIFVRSFTVSGWATKGALNLNNTTEGEPLWKDFDGVKDLSFNDLTFNDGRKDGKEGTDNGAQTNEENQGLNPNIIENWAATVNVGTADKPKVGFGADKNDGVTLEPQLLFGGDPETNGGYFYVIPRNEKPGQSAGVDVTIVYDVETIDPKLAATISDGETHGTSVENVISKKHILGEKIDFEAGKQYLVKIHIGMTSVKIEAVVTDWVPTNDEDVDLPDNQPMPCWTVDGLPGYFLEDPTEGVDVPVTLIRSAEDFNNALAAGPIKNYYEHADTVTVSGVKFKRAGAARYNETLDKYDDQSGLGYVDAATWEANGYKRCWKGMLQDDGVTSGQFYSIDLGANPLTKVQSVKLVVNGTEYAISGVDAAWIANKVSSRETWFWGNIAKDAQVTADVTEIKAKYYYDAADVKYHETKY